MSKNPIASGFQAALRHRRLAGAVWFSLAASTALTLPILGTIASPFDSSPFRESTLRGWDSWGMLSWLAFKAREIQTATPALLAILVVCVLLQLFLSGGLLRVLVADVARPVMKRFFGESVDLFKPILWATIRFALTLAIWEVLLVGVPLKILEKIAGEDAPPNGPLASFGEIWMFVVGTLVLLNVAMRFDLARIALAKGDAPRARGAYRVAKERLRDSRTSVILLALFWMAVFVVLQAGFTNLGLAMNPSTGGELFALVLVRQIGFFLLAMVRVGWWASLMAWEEARRPVAIWKAPWKPVPAKPVVTTDAPSPPQAVLG